MTVQHQQQRHRYALRNVGVASLVLRCSCGWQSSIVGRDQAPVVYAQWRGHRATL